MRTPFVIFAALLLAVPVAAANWNYRGNNEPDTAFDTSTWMWEDADTSPTGRKIYFNGFARVARETHYNPNVALLGSRMQPPVTTMSMVLGFWKDCNGDGYVGNLEQSFLEYRSELLLERSICPPVAPASGVNANGFIYPHNDGTWVRELIWIGPRLGGIGAAGQNPTNFYTTDTTGVWADWGTPGALPTLVCPTAGVSARSTGAIVDALDCFTYYRGIRAMNDAQAQTGLPVGGWESHDVDNSPSTLNVDNPVYPFLYGPVEPEGHPQEGDFRGYNGGFFGRDTDSQDRRERLVTVVDCGSNGPSTSPSANTDFDPLDPASYPSAYESGNDTYEVATQTAPTGQSDCDPQSSSDEGLPYPTVESYTETTFADAGRVSADFAAEFSVGSRNLVPGAPCAITGAGDNRKTSFAPHPVLGYCPPMDAGLAVERDDLVIGPAWRTNAQVNTYGTTTREGLKTGQADIGAFYFTFYARVGADALTVGQRPSAGEAIYGSEPCGGLIGPGEPVKNGWACDPQDWVDRCSDPELEALPALCYRVGFPYHLRDVDCWDGTIARGTGVHASLADVSQTGPCAANPANDQIDTDFT